MNTTGDWWFSDMCRTIPEYVVCLFLTLYNKCGYMFSFKKQFLFDLLAEQTSRWRRTRLFISNHPAFEWKQVDQTRPTTNNLGQSNLHTSWHGMKYAANIKFRRLPLVVSQHFSDTIQSKIWTYEYHIIQYNTVVPSTTGAVCWHRCGCVQIVAHRKGAMWKLLLSTSQHNHPLADLRYLCTALTENIW